MKQPIGNHSFVFISSSTGLAGYLAGAAGFTAALAAPQADAAVTAVTFGFGPTLESTDTNQDWTVGSYGTMRALGTYGMVRMGYPLISGIGTVYHNSSASSNRGLPSFFPNGTVIGNNLNGSVGTAYWRREAVPALDFTSDQLNQNIGFKTNANNWGYANVSWTEVDHTLTINSAYVESVANTPITVGSVPEPGVATLLVLGAVAAARGRRRERSATPAAQD